MLPDAWHPWISLLVTAAVFLAMWRRGGPTDLLFLGALVVVTVCGVITPDQALAGFANPAVITIGSLFVVAAGLRSTGVLDQVGYRLLGTARTATAALVRLTYVLVGVSAVVNNTPVVAMFVPVVLDWCRRRGISPSRLLIPVSYLAILGGTCTLVGTSTNIIGHGLLTDAYQVEAQHAREGRRRYSPEFHAQLRGMKFWEIGQVGLPCALIGSVYLLVLGRRFLPNRTELIEQLDERRREYLVEMLVKPECRLIGKTVEEAGLRHLRGLFLVEINRSGEVIAPITPSDVIRDGDRLVFTGVVTTIVDLEKIPGLVPAADFTYAIHPQERQQRHLAEAVLSRSSPLIGRTVREAAFRQRYNAAVVAVHRSGERLPSKIGDIELQAGDTLLLQTQREFTTRYRHSRDFYLVANVEGSQPRRHDRAWLALALVVALIVWLVAASMLDEGLVPSGLVSPAVAAITIAGLMLACRCLRPDEARSEIDLQVLVTIAGALGLGAALRESGAAERIAAALVDAISTCPRTVFPYLLLATIYALTVVFTETISNNAVAAMLFPIAVATAAAAELNPRPFVMAILLAASLSFLTPIGYQTNLMVMGPGGYQPRDYLRAGWPLTLLAAATAMVLIPMWWPFALPALP
ncbi:MAG: SLC13 family permease [Pirellulales bacterium]|nr:SLC13 family permease [Pirellulales bacterium]